MKITFYEKIFVKSKQKNISKNILKRFTNISKNVYSKQNFLLVLNFYDREWEREEERERAEAIPKRVDDISIELINSLSFLSSLSSHSFHFLEDNKTFISQKKKLFVWNNSTKNQKICFINENIVDSKVRTIFKKFSLFGPKPIEMILVFSWEKL